MKIYNWYKIFNLTDWISRGLVQQRILLLLEDRGRTEFLVTQGNTTAILFADQFLPVDFLGMNPYASDQYAVYIDENQDVFFGFEVLS